MTALRLGSLFSGIGGLDLGVEHATGARTVWQVEADAWCRSVLARHWPDARRYDDVCTAGNAGHELESVDIIAGGFPCQDVSVAGKRAGLTGGERSGLWREFARIVRVVRPRFVFVENVAGLLSMEFGHVLGDLAALGFDAEWTVLRASDAGAPHRRERVFVLAVGDSAGARREGRAGESVAGARRVSSVTGGADEGVADAERWSAQRRGSAGIVGGARGAAQGEAQERQRRRDAAGGRGEAGNALADADSGRCELVGLRGVLDGERSALGHDADGRDGACVADPRRERSQGIVCAGAASGSVDGRGAGSRRAQPRLGRGADGLSRGLDAHRWPAGRGEAQREWEPPRVAQGIPERRQRLKALGNAVVPQQAALAWRVLSERFTARGAA